MAKKVEFNKEAVKKYIFWVCVPLGLIAAVVLGFMAVGDVAAKLDERKKQLDSQKTAVESLRSGAASHPNQGTIDDINKQTEELVNKVYTGWETLEKDQKEQNRWDGLADRAVRDIASKKFLDNLEPTTLSSYLNFAQDEIKKLLDKSDIRRCRIYRRLPNGQEEPLDPRDNEPILVSDSGSFGSGGYGSGGYGSGSDGSTGRASRSPAMGSSRSGAGGIMGPMGTEIMKGKVVWGNPQVDITMSNWTQQPMSHEVWLTQEDLWVYQALLWVVAKSNAESKEASRVVPASSGMMGGISTAMGASRPLDLSGSVVKEIVEMTIGRKAAMALSAYSSRRISMGGMGMDGMGMDGGMMGGSSMGMGSGMMSGGMGMDSSGGMSGGMGMDSSGGMGMGMGMDGATMGAAAMADAAKAAALMGRYVDTAGTLLMEADLTGQFRRMPIYLCFVVDQKRISDVLVNCANCPMPIDVLWVTVNPDATSPFNFVTASPTGMGGSDSYSAMPSRGGGSGRGGGRAGRSGSDSSTGGMGSGTEGANGGILGLPNASLGGGTTTGSEIDFGADAVMIEIYGCINIFTPPDRQKIMGTPEGDVSMVTGM